MKTYKPLIFSEKCEGRLIKYSFRSSDWPKKQKFAAKKVYVNISSSRIRACCRLFPFAGVLDQPLYPGRSVQHDGVQMLSPRHKSHLRIFARFSRGQVILFLSLCIGHLLREHVPSIALAACRCVYAQSVPEVPVIFSSEIKRKTLNRTPTSH